MARQIPCNTADTDFYCTDGNPCTDCPFLSMSWNGYKSIKHSTLSFPDTPYDDEETLIYYRHMSAGDLALFYDSHPEHTIFRHEEEKEYQEKIVLFERELAARLTPRQRSVYSMWSHNSGVTLTVQDMANYLGVSKRTIQYDRATIRAVIKDLLSKDS